MASTYQTREGDTLDAVCWKEYGRTAETTEAVLEANPGLADKGPVFAAGIKIYLPDLPPPETENVIRIWG